MEPLAEPEEGGGGELEPLAEPEGGGGRGRMGLKPFAEPEGGGGGEGGKSEEEDREDGWTGDETERGLENESNIPGVFGAG